MLQASCQQASPTGQQNPRQTADKPRGACSTAGKAASPIFVLRAGWRQGPTKRQARLRASQGHRYLGFL